jgi:hypothetical protein
MSPSSGSKSKPSKQPATRKHSKRSQVGVENLVKTISRTRTPQTNSGMLALTRAVFVILEGWEGDAAGFSLVAYIPCYTNLKMEAIFSFETSAKFYLTRWCHIAENSTLHNNS